MTCGARGVGARPDAVVERVVNFAGYRNQLQWQAALGIKCVESQGPVLARASRSDARLKAKETVLALGLLADGEDSGVLVLVSAPDMPVVLGVV